MNKKSMSATLLMTLAMVLCVATVVYAWTVGGYSSIGTSYTVVTGRSYTTSDVTCDIITACNWLYKNGSLVDNNAATASYQNAVSVSTSALNPPGTQYWETYGSHKAYKDGVYKRSSSTATTNW
ncbi:MAG: hypothetical protein ACOY31_01685 [Bacillota bacterium]